MVSIVLTFRTEQSGTSSGCFQTAINCSEAEKEEEKRGGRGEDRENEEQ